MKQILCTVISLLVSFCLHAQIDSIKSKISFTTDFRFRVEQDWNSRKSDGTFREDRSRLRYRWRGGLTYKDDWYSTGFRLRTGNPIKQQDPQLTLGTGPEEFGTLSIGLEKAYFQGKLKSFIFWLGKHTFPFEKSNELFWSDNVFPEGVFVGHGFNLKSQIIDSLDVRIGHFTMGAAGLSFDRDAYVQGYQIYTSFLDHRIEFFPSFYLFRNIPHIPDGFDDFDLDYSILQIGTRIKLLKNRALAFEFDYYRNLEAYEDNNSIDNDLKNQKSGLVAGLKYGVFKNRGDWLFKACYANLERYSAVDYMTQNDWARWDYSSFGSPDGRLTNLQGVELTAGYMIADAVSLIVKYYYVEQLIAYGQSLENGSRIRFDIDIKI